MGLGIWDIPGNEQTMALNRMYYRDAHAAVVLYDVTKEDSLEHAERWIEELREAAPTELIIVLAGNKMETPPNKHLVQLHEA